jgi:nucleoid-associated protein YgaU
MGNATKVALVALLVLMVVVVARFVREDSDPDGVSSSDPGGRLAPAGAPRNPATKTTLTGAKNTVPPRTGEAGVATRDAGAQPGRAGTVSNPSGTTPATGSALAAQRPAGVPAAAAGTTLRSSDPPPVSEAARGGAGLADAKFKPLTPGTGDGGPGIAPGTSATPGVVTGPAAGSGPASGQDVAAPRPIVNEPLVSTRLVEPKEKDTTSSGPRLPADAGGTAKTGDTGSLARTTSGASTSTTTTSGTAGGRVPSEPERPLPPSYAELAKEIPPPSGKGLAGDAGAGGRVSPGAAGAGGEAARQSPASPRSFEEAPRTHVVEAGDTYWRLAERFYGNGVHASLIQKANPGVKMQPGRKLTIPPAPSTSGDVARAPGNQPAGGSPTESATKSAGASVARGSASKKGSSPALASGEYVVQKGDTLTSIARKFYGDASKFHLIEEANGNLKYQTLRVGARIRVPGLK